MKTWTLTKILQNFMKVSKQKMQGFKLKRKQSFLEKRFESKLQLLCRDNGKVSIEMENE